jgi:hypothetical protein
MDDYLKDLRERREEAEARGYNRDASLYHAYVTLGCGPTQEEVSRLGLDDLKRRASSQCVVSKPKHTRHLRQPSELAPQRPVQE